MSSTTPWLTEAEQRAWRSWLAVNAQLPAVLHRQLQRDSALSLQDFGVLVQLSETDDRRARVSDLAHTLQWERSRLSHHVKRMAVRGLVAREECADDGRGAYVVLTDEGQVAIDRAAPGHAQTVKDVVFGSFTETELEGFTNVTEKVLARLERTS